MVLEGQSLMAGQEVARIVDDDARLAVQRAEAAFKTAHALREAAIREWEHPVERQRDVAVAEAKLAEVVGELTRLDAEISVEASRVAEWTEQLRREEKAGAALAEYQAVRTRLQLETQRAMLSSARGKAPILEARRRATEAELNAARDNLRLRIPERRAVDETTAVLAGAQVARDEAALRLARMSVRTPVDGVVLRRLVEPGTKLMLGGDSPASTRVVSLYDPARLQVRVDVPLADAARVGAGQKAKVTVEVLPDQTLDATVSRITHEADLQKNTLQVKVRLEKPQPELKPEMLARVQFLASASKTGAQPESARVFAPERLIRREGGRSQTWVAETGRGTAVLRDVTTGPGRMEGWIEVTEGLVPGDRLIADAPVDLRNGDRIVVAGESEN
jgi:RND family efflux transporter MFP subunit